jgi:hypothetical protein
LFTPGKNLKKPCRASGVKTTESVLCFWSWSCLSYRPKKNVLFLDDRAAEAGRGLMAVIPDRIVAQPVTRPGGGVQPGIADIPRGGAVKLVGTGLSAHLNLRSTASFYIHRGDDDSHFVEQIRSDKEGWFESLSVPARIHRHAVQRDSDIRGSIR